MTRNVTCCCQSEIMAIRQNRKLENHQIRFVLDYPYSKVLLCFDVVYLFTFKTNRLLIAFAIFYLKHFFLLLDGHGLTYIVMVPGLLQVPRSTSN